MGPASQQSGRVRRWILEALLVSIAIGAAFAIRVHRLDADGFWVDEAESAVNALTILQKGYPTDTYLGLPIYENTLVRSWPENHEYEFRDLSYSDQHYAVYHGWLPLYLIAGSFRLYGVQPDIDDGSRKVKHDLNDRKRRTRAARLPGVIVGSLFLLIAYAGGRVLYGRDAAWSAVIVAAIYPWHLGISRQARYYSLQIALTTLCCLCLWLLLTRCRWRDVGFTACAFILLFHTHLLSFGTAALMALLLTPLILHRHAGAVRKLAAFAVLVAAGIVPWVILTGFFDHHGHIPAAWSLLHLPADLLDIPPLKIVYVLLGLPVVLLVAWAIRSRTRGHLRLRAPLLQLAPRLVFLCAWMLCGYALFLRFIPAASFGSRVLLIYWGPMFLLAAAICAACARAIAIRYSVFTAPVVMLLLFWCTGHSLTYTWATSGHSWQDDVAVLDFIDGMHLDSGSRLYASPNDHLIYSVYSGLPVQSLAPVRKSFLDSYPHDIVYIDQAFDFRCAILEPERIQRAARQKGQVLTAEDAQRWSLLIRTRAYRESMLTAVGSDAASNLEFFPQYAGAILNQDVKATWFSPMDEVMTRGFDVRTLADWRNVFEYRFVDPAQHSCTLSNFAQRFRGAEAFVLSAKAVVFRSRWHAPGTPGTIAFRFRF